MAVDALLTFPEVPGGLKRRESRTVFWLTRLANFARSIDPDFALNFPENPTPDLIKEDVRQELTQALSIYDEGNVKKTEEILLRTLLRIVTPHRQN